MQMSKPIPKPEPVTTLTDAPECPPALACEAVRAAFPRVWSFGDLNLLNEPLVGLFCSAKCPGDAIVKAYDLARALRDNGIPTIGGFHSPMEKECLDLLLRGSQPVVVCPARSLVRMRVPQTWRQPIADGRLLVLSPFEEKQRRMTAALAEQRNQLVAALATRVVILHAEPGGKADRLAQEIRDGGKSLYELSRGVAECVAWCRAAARG